MGSSCVCRPVVCVHVSSCVHTMKVACACTSSAIISIHTVCFQLLVPIQSINPPCLHPLVPPLTHKPASVMPLPALPCTSVLTLRACMLLWIPSDTRFPCRAHRVCHVCDLHPHAHIQRAWPPPRHTRAATTQLGCRAAHRAQRHTCVVTHVHTWSCMRMRGCRAGAVQSGSDELSAAGQFRLHHVA